MGRGSEKLWPTELLEKDIGLNSRIMLVRFDSRRLEREHFIFNLPDHEIDNLTDDIAE